MRKRDITKGSIPFVKPAKSENLEKLLNKVFGDITVFSEMKKPLKIVCTDLKTGKEVDFDYGNVAKVVGEKFAVIAKDIQIIAITHLPQISAMADNNLLIVKSDDGVTTHTNVFELDNDKKILEIMRLVGGDANSEAAKKHAEELINSAIEFKKKII